MMRWWGTSLPFIRGRFIYHCKAVQVRIIILIFINYTVHITITNQRWNDLYFLLNIKHVKKWDCRLYTYIILLLYQAAVLQCLRWNSGIACAQRIAITRCSEASGPDGIRAVVIKRCAAELSPVLMRLCRISYVSDVVPRAWREENVQPIPKKRDWSDPKNYCPIVITSV